MSVGEFTASSINVEEDKRGEKDDQKESQLDLDKFKQDVAANVQLSQQVID